jgi:outer membrane protein assembly factor BamB
MIHRRQIGTVADDIGNDGCIDSNKKMIAVGKTYGDLTMSNAGGSDAFVASFNADGSVEQTKQFGSSSDDEATSMMLIENNNLIVVGNTDVFIIRLDEELNVVWTIQMGSSEDDFVGGLTQDSNGNIVIVGTTYGSISIEGHSGGQDAFIATLNINNGDILWTKQIGTELDDTANEIVTDNEGHYFIVGATGGILNDTNPLSGSKRSNTGGMDAFLILLDQNNVIWTNQFGGDNSNENAVALTVKNERIYVVGNTDGSISDQAVHSGGSDVFISSFNMNGEVLSLQQLGTIADDEVHHHSNQY